MTTPAESDHEAPSGVVNDDPLVEPGVDLGIPGPRFDRKAPFVYGFLLGLGLLTALAVGMILSSVAGVLVQVVVAFFIAAGLNPSVNFFEHRGMRRNWAVTLVLVLVLAALVLFFVAIVPVITDQVARITTNAPTWFESLQSNRRVQKIDNEYHIIDKVQSYVTDGDFLSGIFGGAVGVGLAVLGALFNTLVIFVLTLYFLSGLKTLTGAFYSLAPASRRDRVSKLGDQVIKGIGGYVSGAFVVALCAGITTAIFLCIIGLSQYAVALAFVVFLLDVIPMIGATIGAVIVIAIAFATDPHAGIACVIFYIAYQQIENYIIYPRVMSRSVDIPGSVTVIAALIGASLLGVVGALLAIPTAAAILLLTREIFVKQQDLA